MIHGYCMVDLVEGVSHVAGPLYWGAGPDTWTYGDRCNYIKVSRALSIIPLSPTLTLLNFLQSLPRNHAAFYPVGQFRTAIFFHQLGNRAQKLQHFVVVFGQGRFRAGC